MVPTAEGQCPSCRQQVPGSQTPTMPAGTTASPSEKPPVVMAPPGLDLGASRDAADSDNPYLAPQISVKDNSSVLMSDTPPYGGLIWMLFSFRGRIPRRLYWALSIAITLAYYLSAGAVIYATEDTQQGDLLDLVFLPIVVIFFWTTLAVQVKRWHDRGKSGLWVLVNIIPFAGPLIAFVELGCLRGTFGSNQYGPDPT